MPNQDAEAEWRKQNRRNKDIQADIEKLKQEVYNEGLQVEEEGLTDIVRKKTKLPYQSNENDRLHHNNDPAIYVSIQYCVSKISSRDEFGFTELLMHKSIQVPFNFCYS